VPHVTRQLRSEDGVVGAGGAMLAQWIKVSCGMTLEQNCLHLEILDRKTKWVKFN
jgi:hypothetical protein